MPVKVKQINENLFSDTTKSNNIKEQRSSGMRMDDSEMTMR